MRVAASSSGMPKHMKRVRKAHVKFAGLATATRKRYRTSVLKFFRFLSLRNTSYPNSLLDLDFLVAEYVNHEYQDDGSFSRAQTLASALRRLYPPCRRSLHLAGQYLANWGKELVRKRALPLPQDVCLGMAGAALAQGDPGFATILLVGFVGLLRPMGMVLKARQIRVLRQGSTAILLFENSKGATRRGSPETVMIHDPGVVGMLSSRIAQVGADGFIFGGTWHDLQLRITKYAKYMGLAHPDLTPYCIRRGGATWHFEKYANLHATQHLGRWAQPATAKVYIDQAMVAQASSSLDPAAKDLLAHARAVCARMLRQYGYEALH